MAIYTEGIAEILEDGNPMSVSQIITKLNQADGNWLCDSCGEWKTEEDGDFGEESNLCHECSKQICKSTEEFIARVNYSI